MISETKKSYRTALGWLVSIPILLSAYAAQADQIVKGISSSWFAKDGVDLTKSDTVRKAALLKLYPFPVGYGNLTAPSQPAAPATTDPYFNWADRNGEDWLTPVRNQGGCGSCFVFGAVSVMESLFKIAINDWNYNPDLSEQKVVSCISMGSCASGGTAEEVAAHLKSEGTPDEECDPYTSGNTGSDGNCANKCSDWQARASKISNWSMSILPPSVNDLKNQLQNGPVIANLQVYSDFYGYSAGVYSRSGSATAEGWHIVTLAGWDDSDNSWIIKNSWDTDWGMDGFGKISRAADCILFTTGLCFASHTTYLTVDAAEAPSAPCTNPREVSIEAWVGETTHGVPVTLKNCGKKGAFDWTGAVSPYSTLSKTSGTLAAAQEQALTVNLKPSQMGVGNRVVTVKFSSGTMEAVTLINVSVKSAPPADGGTTDAGKDAGVADAGLDSGFDAGFDAGLDGGKTDGGTDSGIQVDSGTVNDSGVMDDSGATDGALAVDSGYGSDSSFPADGSSPGDASQAQDGGSESDGDAPVAQAAGCSCSMLGF